MLLAKRSKESAIEDQEDIFTTKIPQIDALTPVIIQTEIRCWCIEFYFGHLPSLQINLK
jgi:hypothetical protein